MDLNSINRKLETLFELSQNKQGSFEYKGVDLIQIIRSELQFSLRKEESVDEKVLNYHDNRISVVGKLKGRYQLKKKFLEVSKEVNQYNLEKSDVVLFSKSNAYYSDSINGELYHRHLDPFVEVLEGIGKSVSKLHFLSENERGPKMHASKCIQLSKTINDWVWSNSYYNRYPTSQSFIDFCNKVDVNYRNIIARADYIVSFSEVVYLALKELRPKIIGLVCFYGDESMAVILAAKKLGIKTIDLQHGKQGERHFCYTNYAQKPNDKISLFPDLFWNWNESSKNNINSKISNVDARIKCIVGGNLWMSKWKNNFTVQLNNEQNVFMSKFHEFKHKVMIGTQPVGDDPVPLIVQELIGNRKDILWLIRLHPYQVNLMEEVSLKYSNYENVEVQNSTTLPLYFLLNKVDFIVTKWSSVALEALNFNVKSIIVDKFGEESFKNEIQEGKIDLALDKITLNELLATANLNEVVSSSEGIVTDKEIIDKSIKELLSL